MMRINAAATVWRMERWAEPFMAGLLEEALEEALTGGDWAAVLGERPPLELATDLEGAPLSGRDLTGINLTTARLSYADLSGADLTGATLLNIRADHADFTGAVLAHADLSASWLSHVRFTGCRAPGLRMSQTDLMSCDLSDADLTGADLTDTNVIGSVIDTARLDGTVTTGLRGRRQGNTWYDLAPRHRDAVSAMSRERQAARARWSDPEQAANLENVIRAAKRGQDWQDVRYPLSDGDYTDLEGAPLAGRDLSGTDLFQAKLSHADLSGTDLTGARLGMVEALGADLSRAVLDRSDISSAVLSRADLTGASLKEAVIDKVLFIKAVLDRADFTAARISASTMYEASRAGTLLHGADTEGLRM